MALGIPRCLHLGSVPLPICLQLLGSAGDVIVSLDGRRVRSPFDLSSILDSLTPGRAVPVGVLRGVGQSVSRTVGGRGRELPFRCIALQCMAPPLRANTASLCRPWSGGCRAFSGVVGMVPARNVVFRAQPRCDPIAAGEPGTQS